MQYSGMITESMWAKNGYAQGLPSSIPVVFKNPLDQLDTLQRLEVSSLPRRSSSVSNQYIPPTQVSPSAPGRKLSRKLPPNMTESLEMLAVYPTPAEVEGVSTTMAAKELFPAMYTLEVGKPTGEMEDQPVIHIQPRKNSSSRKAVPKKLSMSGALLPTTQSPITLPRLSMSSTSSTEADSLPPLTPKTSLRSLNPVTRSQLFAPSRFNPASISSRASTEEERESSTPSSSSSTSINTPSSPTLTSDVPALSCGSNSANESSCGTWSSTFDTEYHSIGKKGETRKARKARKQAENQRFDESTPPTTKELYEASLMDVIDERGMKVRFGDLVRGKKTIVVFIRHWFCPLCAQYIKSIIRDVSKDALEEAGVELIIIGNGSSKMINGYANKYFNSPFKTYTDPTLSLYRILGLTRQTSNAGSDADKGDYLTETALETTVNTLKRATKMPLRNPGHFTQLGGEFIFDNTLNVTYTHRMVNTRDHAPIRDVCAEAGVRLEFIHYEPGPPPPLVHAHSDVQGDDGQDLDGWMMEKEKTLERIRAMKAERRKGSVSDLNTNGLGKEVLRIEEHEGEDAGEFGQFTPSKYLY